MNMASVIQSGWLILLLCAGIVLLLAACVALGTRTPTQPATDFPLVTLTVVPFATEPPQPDSILPTVLSHPFSPVSDWIANRASSSGTHSDDPTCYNSPNQGFLCLGRVWNETTETLSNITVRVSLFGDNGGIVAQQVIGLEQRYLPPKTSAPYRARFEQVATASENAHSAIEMLLPVALPAQPIHVTGERGVIATTGRYIVTANLHNTSERLAEHIRLVVTLLDDTERVVGYRIQAVEPLAAGTERSVRMELIPQVMAADLHHLLHVESWQ
jgi:hypothetical protein